MSARMLSPEQLRLPEALQIDWSLPSYVGTLVVPHTMQLGNAHMLALGGCKINEGPTDDGWQGYGIGIPSALMASTPLGQCREQGALGAEVWEAAGSPDLLTTGSNQKEKLVVGLADIYRIGVAAHAVVLSPNATFDSKLAVELIRLYKRQARSQGVDQQGGLAGDPLSLDRLVSVDGDPARYMEMILRKKTEHHRAKRLVVGTTPEGVVHRMSHSLVLLASPAS